MTEKEKTVLSLMCGALKDISENTNEEVTESQINEVRRQLEHLITHPELPEREY